MTKFKAATATLMGFAALATAHSAQAATLAGGVRASTLGFGAEATLGLNDYLNLRLPFNTFTYSGDETEDGIRYEGKLKLRSIGGQVDVHPFKGSFFLGAGLYSNGNKLRLHASDPTGSEQYDIGNRTYTSDPNDPLVLDGGLKTQSMAPYLGLGWGNPIQGNSNFYFRFEMGAYFQGAGKIKLDASGSAVDEDGNSFDVDGGSLEAQGFQQNLEQERADVEDDISKYKIYPVIALSLGYRFSF